MEKDLREEIKKEEKTLNFLLIAVLSPIFLGILVFSFYLFGWLKLLMFIVNCSEIIWFIKLNSNS